MTIRKNKLCWVSSMNETIRYASDYSDSIQPCSLILSIRLARGTEVPEDYMDTTRRWNSVNGKSGKNRNYVLCPSMGSKGGGEMVVLPMVALILDFCCDAIVENRPLSRNIIKKGTKTTKEYFAVPTFEKVRNWFIV